MRTNKVDNASSSVKETTFKIEKKNIFNPKKNFNFNNFKKKKSLFSKEDVDDESDDSLGHEGETFFMTKFDVEKASTSQPDSQINNQSNLENCEINLEGELICVLQEIKRLNKHITSQEQSLNKLIVTLQMN